MKYLIDTHAFIWYSVGDAKLSAKAKEIIDSESEKYISIASLWEMSIKVSIGKLTFVKPFEEIIEEQLRINNYQILPINKSHLFMLSSLELHHRDPFDRIIICQSIAEKIPVVTVDERFKEYKDLSIAW